jgi:RimJ/RimL family protein N-acetyltransferase
MISETIRLRDGRLVLVRELRIEDEEKLVRMYASLSSEALRWALPPYTRERIERWLSNLQNLIAMVALDGDRIVGHAQISKFAHPRRRGTADLLIYLHQDFHGVGLGSAMMARLLELARRDGLHRLNLDVVAENRAAVRFYQKLGFTVEGVKKEAYLGEDERYHDELVMALILHES